jgi:PAS domain S-box-containing protein
MKEQINILIVDDDEADRLQIKRAIKQANVLWQCTETAGIEQAAAVCEQRSFDCAIVDYQLQGCDGLAGISALHDLYPFMAVIMSTGQGDEMIAVDAMKRGASDYIPKTKIDSFSMRRSIERSVEQAVLQRQLAQQRDQLEKSNRRLEMIFETAGIGDWTWNIANGEITAHPMVWALFGSPGRQGAAPAAWFRDRLHPLDADIAWTEISAALLARRPFNTEFRVVWPDQSVHWLACHGVVVADKDDIPIHTYGLNIDINERKTAQLGVQESERRFRQQANAMPQIVCTSGPTGIVDSYNDRWYEYSGFSVDHSRQSGWQSAIHPDDSALCAGISQREFTRGMEFELECRLQRHADGAFRWHLARFIPYRDEHGNILRWFGTFTDIHEHKIAKERLEAEVFKRTLAMQQLQSKEKQLEHSLAEQTVLLKEVHHRVKNNLQVISSLLRMQGELLRDPVASQALKESQNRVSSMALIHEQLYSDGDMVQIDFAEFTRTLVNALFGSYTGSSSHITSRMNVSPVFLNADQAIPCGLILNELVTNALKYAYPDGQRGEVVVELRETEGGCVSLSVSDKGVGFEDELALGTSGSLGLTLVNTLTDQLGGKLDVISKPSAAFTVSFDREPLSASAKSGF